MADVSRIIAGSSRGRRITMPHGSATRPTSDRVREAVFTTLVSWLGTADAAPGATFAGIAVADLCAGSGAIGLEAASRGAAPVLLVERDRRTADLARRNAATLGADVTVRATRIEALAAEPAATPYDIIWLDPPYEMASDHLDTVLTELATHGWLAADGLFVVERSRRAAAPTWPAAVTDAWSKTYGETVIHYGRS